MKHLITILLLLGGMQAYAQTLPTTNDNTVKYEYDEAGNRVLRYPAQKPKEVAPVINNVSVFPNPSSGIFYVEFKEPVEDALLQVYTSSGQVLITRELSGESTTIDLRSMSQGEYLLTLDYDGKLEEHKLVKQE